MDPINMRIEKVQLADEQACIDEYQAADVDSLWRKGRAASEWCKKYAAGRTQQEFAELVGVTQQAVSYQIQIYERWNGVYNPGCKLTQKHFRYALNWERAEIWLDIALEKGWSAAEMKREYDLQQQEMLGDKAPDDAPDVPVASGETSDGFLDDVEPEWEDVDEPNSNEEPPPNPPEAESERPAEQEAEPAFTYAQVKNPEPLVQSEIDDGRFVVPKGPCVELMQAINLLLRDIKKNDRGTELLAEQVGRLGIDLKNAKSVVVACTPYAVCPMCLARDKHCPLCSGRFWITKPQFKNLEEADRVKAANHTAGLSSGGHN